MKLQTPVLLAVVVPSALVPPSDTVTVEPAGAVPVRVTDLSELTMPRCDGPVRPGVAGTVTSNGLDAALVPADVVSVAVKAYEPADKAAS